MKKMLVLLTILMALALQAFAAGSKGMPDSSYKKVSDLVSLPEFIPGMGTLYVKPATLPVGPYLAYDRKGTLVSTIYMVPLSDMEKHENFKGLMTGNGKVKMVDVTFNPGHPGLDSPHYHITIWHVNPTSAKLK